MYFYMKDKLDHFVDNIYYLFWLLNLNVNGNAL